MAQHRFFVPPDLLLQSPITLEGALAHQLSRVLRLKPGDQIELLDGQGEAYLVALEQVTPRRCLAIEINRYRPDTEPATRFVLYQAISKGQKLDWVWQKATELGVSELVPMATTRTIGAELRQVGATRLERLQRIAQEAAEQSGRARIPQVRPAITFEEALSEREPGNLALIGALTPEALSLQKALEDQSTSPGTVRLYVGPEGGLDDNEVSQARNREVQPISLGPRTLRTETAGIALLAILAYALGDMETR